MEAGQQMLEKRIMVVNDNALALKMLSKILGAEYEVSSFNSPMKATLAALNSPKDYDLVILAPFYFSNLSPVRVTRQIREKELDINSYLPIILFSENVNVGLDLDFLCVGGTSIIRDFKDKSRVFRKIAYYM